MGRGVPRFVPWDAAWVRPDHGDEPVTKNAARSHS